MEARKNISLFSMKLDKIFFTLKKDEKYYIFQKQIKKCIQYLSGLQQHDIPYDNLQQSAINQTLALCFFHVSGFRNIDMHIGTLI